MQQAFPVSPELSQLLNSRPSPNLTSGQFAGLTSCELHITNTASVIDPNTGQTFKTCGPNSAWRLATQLTFLPPRGTVNDVTTYQLVTGIKGDTGLGDWTYDAYASQGESRTNTEYEGYISTANYAAIVSAPNYGRGYSAQSNGVSNKRLSCTSGIDPWQQAAGTLQVSQDCIDAVTSNQTDRESMEQLETALNLQGGLFDLPAGQIRSAIGLSYRRNDYAFTPDSLRESDYIYDTTPGQFGVGFVDGVVTAKEIYGELLIPVLARMPGAQSLELELGFRQSKYSTGQSVPTYKAQLSWAPIDWLRFRGGFNRAERTPNIAELYTSTTVSSQLSGVGNDPCRNGVTNALPTQSNTAANPNRAQLLALCSAQINAWGGNNASSFHADPLAFNTAGGVLTFQGNPDLKSEQGDTWTAGVVFRSPFEHALARRMTATVDWYSVKISNPIDVVSGQLIVDACFNVNGTNPNYQLDDPTGYCRLIERDPSSGGIRTINAIYDNIGRLGVEGIDTTIRWSAPLADMGIESLPGALSVSFGANVLLKQEQPVSVGGEVLNYAGYVGSARLRTNTNFNYSWGDSRVGVTWLYRTQTAALVNNRPSDQVAGYKWGHLFNLSAGTRLRENVDVGVSVSNLLNTKPTRGGYFYADQTQGFGTFNPYGDLVGRRFSVSLTATF
jgi:outer membrane receptor protein involved in Fe transport